MMKDFGLSHMWCLGHGLGSGQVKSNDTEDPDTSLTGIIFSSSSGVKPACASSSVKKLDKAR